MTRQYHEFALDHPLDAITAKLERANEHILDVKQQVRTYLSTPPGPYTITSKLDDDRSTYRFYASGDPRPPLKIAIVAGEAIHQLRASLDHLVVALAKTNKGKPPFKSLQFPVCSKREKFKKAIAEGKIKGVSKSAFRRIVRTQPYHLDAPTEHTLWAIHDFDIRDKHQLLLITTVAARLGQSIEVDGSPSDGGAIELKGFSRRLYT